MERLERADRHLIGRRFLMLRFFDPIRLVRMVSEMVS